MLRGSGYLLRIADGPDTSARPSQAGGRLAADRRPVAASVA
jgi:hypothetical protein